jgi:uroporphyrinogen decarboxylase
MQISCTPEFAARLRAELGRGGASVHSADGRSDEVDLDLALGTDLLLAPSGWVNPHYADTRRREPDGTWIDEWQVRWKEIPYDTRFGPGAYTEMVAHPLSDDAALDAYEPPDPLRPELFVEAEHLIRDFKSEYWIVGMTVCTIFEAAWALRGYEQLLTDFKLDASLADRILDIPFRHHLATASRLVDMGVDMIWTGDDVGAQHAMLMSPETWRRFLKPRLGAFIATLKQKNPALKVAYHTDGSIYQIIPDLIEIGVDVLNPIQPQSMDPVRLKREYGDRLCFWGTIDIQQTLPYGTPDEVRAEVRDRLHTVGAGGGLIIGPTHNVQLDTPMENFRTMVETVTGRRA